MTRVVQLAQRCVVLLVVLFLLAGCVKLRQVVTVMPDGSGKIELTFAQSPQLIDLARESKEDPFKEVLPEVLAKTSKGIVAMTQPKRSVEEDFTYLTYTMYFRDINKVHIEGLGETRPAEYAYQRDGDKAALTITHGTCLSMIARYEPTPEQERADMREALAGLAISEHFILPGKVTPIDGVSTDANTAKLDLTLDHLLDGTGPIEKFKGKTKLTFEVPSVSIDQQAIDAFAKELDAAVTAWQEKQKKAP